MVVPCLMVASPLAWVLSSRSGQPHMSQEQPLWPLWPPLMRLWLPQIYCTPMEQPCRMDTCMALQQMAQEQQCMHHRPSMASGG